MTEREEIVERLRGVRLVEDSSFNTERIAAAICDYRGNILAELPLDECEKVRDKLIGLLTETPAATSGERIADELRHLASEWDWLDPEAGESARKFRAIADRIDAKQEEALRREHEAAYDAGYSDGYACANDSLAEHEGALAEREGALAKRGWVRLPKDADGEYIHEHDKVGWRDHSGTWHKNALVVAVCSDGCYVMDGMVFHVHASDIRHYKQSTVEDVLLDCIANVCRANHQLFEQGCYLTMHDVECETDEYIAEYAAKLRLAGGDAE